jgi:hypothetical protein
MPPARYAPVVQPGPDCDNALHHHDRPFRAVHPFCPPWRWKLGLLQSSNVQAIVRIGRIVTSFSVSACPAVSVKVGAGHKTGKSLCERRALPTELYPPIFRGATLTRLLRETRAAPQKALINSPISPPI